MQPPDPHGTFCLSLSNQSYETPKAKLKVEIVPHGDDGSLLEKGRRQLWNGELAVEDQHHWVTEKYKVSPGHYSLIVEELYTRTAAVEVINISTSHTAAIQFWKSRKNYLSQYPFITIEIEEGCGRVGVL